MVRNWLGKPAGIYALAGSSPVLSALQNLVTKNMDYQNILQSLISWVISHGIKVVIILFIAWITTRISKVFVSRLIKTLIEKSEIIGMNGKIQEQRGKTLSNVFCSTLKIVIWIIAILTILPEFGINPTPLLAGAGLIGLAIGLGSKNLVQDYLAGLFILLEDQYRVGEEIDIIGKKGKVIDLTLRKTVIEDAEGIVHYVPNGQIKSSSNLSRK